MSHGRGIVSSTGAPVGGIEVIQDTHDDLNANVTLQIGDADVTEGNPVPVEEIIRAASAWTTVLNAQIFNNVTTTAYSSERDVSTEGAVWVHIFVDSTLAPTDIRVQAQFEDDAGLWWDFEEGLWASLFWEDADTAAGIRKVYLLPCGGQDNIRFNVVAQGTDAANTFECTIKLREFHGNFGVAHA